MLLKLCAKVNIAIITTAYVLKFQNFILNVMFAFIHTVFTTLLMHLTPLHSIKK